MDNTKDKLNFCMKYDEAQTIPLALHETHMARADRRLKYICIAWAASVIVIVLAFVFLWLQYDYESSVETSGVYNLLDSQGNVLTSDISPDDVIRILDVLNDGKSSSNTKP